jgi:hypothetical protein
MPRISSVVRPVCTSGGAAAALTEIWTLTTRSTLNTSWTLVDTSDDLTGSTILTYIQGYTSFGGGRTGYIRILVDDVEKVQASRTRGGAGEADSFYGAMARYEGAGGVVKCQVYQAPDGAFAAGGRRGLYQITGL